MLKEIGSNTDESLYTVDNKNNRKLEYIPVVKMLQNKYHTIAYGSEVYIYDNGKYVKGNEILKADISDISFEAGVKGSIKRPTEEIMHYLKTLDPYMEYPFNYRDDLIPVNNGVVQINWENESIELIPHSPAYRFNYKLCVDYIECNQDSGRIIHNDVICKYVDSADVDVLYQIPAQAILQMLGSAPFKKAYLLQGDPHAGKSTFLDILSGVFGDSAHSHVSLQQISIDRFALSDLEGKIFNVYDDLSNVPFNDCGVFKTLTGSHIHRIQQKGKDGYNAVLTAVHVYTCNTPPDFDKKVQHETAFWERWEYIVFNNHFAIDPYFVERVFTPFNLSEYFHDVLKYVIKVRKNGLLLNSTAGEVRDKWTFNADPLYRFLTDNLVDSTRSMYVDKDKFLTSYQQWCKHSDVDNVKIHGDVSTLTRALDKYEIAPKRVTDVDGLRVQTYEIPSMWENTSEFRVTPVILKSEQSAFDITV